MSLSKKLVFAVAILGVALGAGFGVSEVWGAAQQVFQAGVQYEIDTDTAAQNLDITTKATDGGGITLRVRHNAAPAIYIDTANNVSIGGATPNGAFDVGSAATNNGYFLDGKAALTGETADNWLRLNQSSSWTNGVYTPGVLRVDGELRQGSADAGAYGIQTSGAFYAGGTGTFVGTVSVGAPTAIGHATTKSYVDSAVAGVVSGWTDGGANVYLTTSGDTVSLGSNSASTAPGTKLSLEGSETTNRIVVDGGGPFIQLANRGWSGTAGILFSAYATSSYASGGLNTTGNTWYRYDGTAFGGAGSHRAKMIMTSHNSIHFYISPASPGANLPIAWNERFTITPDYIGVGNPSPTYNLDVSGNMRVVSGDNSYAYYGPNSTWGGSLYVGATPSKITGQAAQVVSTSGNLHVDSAPTSYATYINYYSQTPTYINAQGGNVGIGLTNPNHKLQVTGSIHTTAAEAGGGGNLASDGYDLAGYNIGTQVLYSYGSICAGNASGACNSTGGVTISAGGTVGTPAVAINASGISYFNAGNLGIADTTPTEGTLTVGGTGYFTGTVSVATPAAAGHAATRGYVDGIPNFGNVVVSGQTTVAADSQTDSLTLAAGTNVTITTNATTDTVTINASGGTGDITDVTAGSGLTGGGTTGNVTLNVGAGTGISVAADAVAVDTGAALAWTAQQAISAGEGTYVAPTFGSGNLGALNIRMATSDRRNAITFSSAGAANAQAGIYVHQDNAAGTHMYFATTNSYATGPQARMTILNTGNVGIGTTGPDELLHVSGSAAGTGAHIGDAYVGVWDGNAGYAVFTHNSVKGTSASYALLQDSAGATYLNAATGQPMYFRIANATQMTMNTTGLGIGATPATGAKLDVAGFLQVRSDNSSSPLGGGHYIRGIAGSGGHLVINANASVANTATLYLNYNGDPAGAGPVRIRETLIVNTDGSVNIGATGTNKLNAGTIDPIYTIGGQRYATYVPGMTGQKEETAGTVELKSGKYVIDFAKEEKGSDLWLFAKTINLAEEGMENMSVLLTPSFGGRTWYEKNEAAQRIVIHGDSDGEVSYRLTAPRFDHAQLPNILNDVSVPGTEPVEGFNLDKLLN